MRPVGAILGGLILTACAGADGAAGADGKNGKAGKDGESPTIALSPARASECRAGGTRVEVDDEAFIVCDGEDGEDGEPGEPGLQGPAGPQGDGGPAGPPGEDALPATATNPIVAAAHCYAPLEGYIGVDYWFREFGDGSVWASAIVFDGKFSASGSNLYAPQQEGVQTANVQIAFDLEGPGYGGRWLVGMLRDDLTMVIRYVDDDLLGGESTWARSEDEMSCAVEDLGQPE